MNDNIYYANILNDIAKKFFGIKTLETRNSDALDFYNVAVWSLKDALKEHKR